MLIVNLEHPGFVKNESYYEYLELVTRACEVVPQDTKRKQAVEVLGYCEHHHIIPTCIGGTNDTTNKVWFTAYDHLKAHILLPNMVESIRLKNKLYHAALRMLNKQDHNHKRVYACDLSDEELREIARLKEDHARILSLLRRGTGCGEDNPMYGKTHTDKVKALVSERFKGKPKTEQQKRLIGQANSGENCSNKRMVTCPVCGKTGKSGGMRKYHYDYCVETKSFELIHEPTGERFYGTRQQFTDYLQVAKSSQGQVGSLLRGNLDRFRGWIVKEKG